MVHDSTFVVFSHIQIVLKSLHPLVAANSAR